MSRADLLVEAVHAAIRLGWALAVWIGLCSLAASAAVYAVVVIVVGACRWAWRAARRGAGGPSWRRGRLRARIHTRRRLRRPSKRTAPWVHTQPLHHEWDEAA